LKTTFFAPPRHNGIVARTETPTLARMRLLPALPAQLALIAPTLTVLLLLSPSVLLRGAAEAAPLPDGLYAEFSTLRGVITAELFFQKAPLMCVNFTGLAEGSLAPRDGKPFFTGLTWYRVVPGFVVQSGNPGLKDTDDDKEAHPHRFPDELVPGLRHDAIGTLSMANAGPDTNSCEFFLTLRDTNRLNYLHSVFGRVVRGLEVLPRIKQNDAVAIKILRVGPAARAFKADAAAFKALAAAAKKYSGTAEPGPLAHFDDPARLLPADPPRAKNFNYKLANFERVTGGRIVARMFAKSPSPAEDKVPGAYMRALAKKLGTARRGALVAYFADEQDWRVWIGEESAAAFLGRAATPADLAPEGALHRAKEAFFNAAAEAGDLEFARQQQAAPPDKQPPPAQRLKLRTDALLDTLILKLEPK
jgi:cyclophilin family peptidyl-prolyl cis-trans isomerase